MEDLITTVSYRGFTVPIYRDSNLKICYTILGGKVLFFKHDWPECKHDLEGSIDHNLNLLAEVSSEAWLEQFQNGGYTDVRLVYKGRTLKVFLVQKDHILSEEDLNKLINESKNLLKKLARIGLQ